MRPATAPPALPAEVEKSAAQIEANAEALPVADAAAGPSPGALGKPTHGSRPTRSAPPRNPRPPGGRSQETRPAAHPPRRNRSTMAVDHFLSGRLSARVTRATRPDMSGSGSPLGLCLAVLLVCLSSGTFPLAAQGLGLGAASEDRPIAISAASGIEWQQDAQVYIARGNAVAKRGTTEVSRRHADRPLPSEQGARRRHRGLPPQRGWPCHDQG